MKELAIIALLGGGDLICGDAYLSNGRFYSISGDTTCVIETNGRALCTVFDDETSPPFSAKITLVESNGTLTLYFNEHVVGTCGPAQP